MLAGPSHDEVLREVKRVAAFGGRTMRPNLLRMLKHFGFAELLGIADEAELWGARADLLHSTSVVPHAAFRKNGKPFAGSFGEVQASPALRRCFVEDFVPSLKQLSRETLFIALGPTPLDALKWSAKHGYVEERQIVGAFAHPATTAGSQVAIYLGERRPDELDPRDPVRHRTAWLIDAHDEVARSVARLRQALSRRKDPAFREGPAAIRSVITSNLTKSSKEAEEANLRYVVKRGKGIGTVLTPHKHEDGSFVVSPTRFERDYIRVTSLDDVREWVRKGYSLRMSNQSSASHRSPSLISPASIEEH